MKKRKSAVFDVVGYIVLFLIVLIVMSLISSVIAATWLQ